MAVIDIEYGREILEENEEDGGWSFEKQGSVELEMVLQNASYGHEYAMQELAEATDLFHKEGLASKLENYKRAYFVARRHLSKSDPERLREIENTLLEQKTKFFGAYHA